MQKLWNFYKHALPVWLSISVLFLFIHFSNKLEFFITIFNVLCLFIHVVFKMFIRKKRYIYSKEDLPSLKLIFSAMLSGKVFDWSAGIIVLLFSITISWIPSFLDKGSYMKACVLALISANGFFYLYYRALQSYKKSSQFSEVPEKRKVLIRAISFTPRKLASQEDLKKNYENYIQALEATPCYDLINNRNLDKAIFNLGPLFKAAYYHRENGPLEKIYLLVPNILAICNFHLKEEILKSNKKILHLLEEKLRKCIGEVEIILVEKEKGLDFENFHELRKRLLKLLEEILEKYDSSDITIDISGGTSVVSAALILLAIKGKIQAEYISQKPPHTLKAINTNVWEIKDLIQEFTENINTK